MIDFDHLELVSGISVYVWYVLIFWIPLGISAVLVARYLGNAPAHLRGDYIERRGFWILLLSGPLGFLISLYYLFTNLYDIHKYRKILKEIRGEGIVPVPKKGPAGRNSYGFPQKSN